MAKKFKWTVEFEIDEKWVADGFNFTDFIALDMLSDRLKFADMNDELAARVVKCPTANAVLRAQGYDIDMMSDEAKARELGIPFAKFTGMACGH